MIAVDHRKIKVFNIIMVLALAFALVAAAIAIKTTVTQALVNVPPTVEAGPDQAVQGTVPLTINASGNVSGSDQGGGVGDPYPTVYLDGSMSFDENKGDTLSYLWTQVAPTSPYVGGEWPTAASMMTAGSINNATHKVANFIPPAPGLYEFNLKVTDNGVNQNGGSSPLSSNDKVVVIAGLTWFVRLCGNDTWTGSQYLPDSGPTPPAGAWRTITWATSDQNPYVKNGDRILVGPTDKPGTESGLNIPYGGSSNPDSKAEHILIDKWLTVQSVYGQNHTNIKIAYETANDLNPDQQVVEITWPSGANPNVIANGVVFGGPAGSFADTYDTGQQMPDHGFTLQGAPTGILAHVFSGYTVWQATHAYAFGYVIRPTTDNGYNYRCSTAGTSNSTEPVWDALTTIHDGSGTLYWTREARKSDGPDGVRILWNEINNFAPIGTAKAYCGIQIDLSKMPYVDHNIVDDSNQSDCTDFTGIFLKDCEVGLVIHPRGSGHSESQGAQVTNNDVNGEALINASGITLDNCPWSYVYNNDIYGPGDPGAQCLRVEGSPNPEVHGIELYGGCEYSTVDLNSIKVSVSGFITSVATGIEVEENTLELQAELSDTMTVTNNTIGVYVSVGTGEFGSMLGIGISMTNAPYSLVQGNDVTVQVSGTDSASTSETEDAQGISSLGADALDKMQAAFDGIAGQDHSAVVANAGGLAIGIWAYECAFIHILDNTPVDVSCFVCLNANNDTSAEATVAVGAGSSIAEGIAVLCSTAPTISGNTGVKADADLKAIVTSASDTPPVIAIGHAGSYGLGILVAFCDDFSPYVATVQDNVVSASGSAWVDVWAKYNAAAGVSSDNPDNPAIERLDSALQEAYDAVQSGMEQGLQNIQQLTISGNSDAQKRQLSALGDAEALACGIGITTLCSPGAKIIGNTVSGNPETDTDPLNFIGQTGTMTRHLAGVHMAGLNLEVIGKTTELNISDATTAEGDGLALGIGILDAWCGSLLLGSSTTDTSSQNWLDDLFGSHRTIQILKKDANDHIINLSGATFIITPDPFTGSGTLTVVDNLGSDEDPSNGTILLEDVKTNSNYSIQETVAPVGYNVDAVNNPQTGIVVDNSSHKHVIVTFVDGVLHTGDLVILIRDKYTDVIHLPGAVITVSPNPYGSGDLDMPDGGMTLTLGDSNPNYGIIALEDVPFNTYTITQTGAALGYGDAPPGTATVDAQHPPEFCSLIDPYVQQNYALLTAVTTIVSGNTIVLGDATAFTMADVEAAEIVSNIDCPHADGCAAAVGLGIAVVGCDPLFSDNGGETTCLPNPLPTTAEVTFNNVAAKGDCHLIVDALQLQPDKHASALGLSTGIGVGIVVVGLAFPEITDNGSTSVVPPPPYTGAEGDNPTPPFATFHVEGTGCATSNVYAASVESEDPYASGTALGLGAGIATVWCTDPQIINNCNYHSDVEGYGTPTNPTGPWVTGTAYADGDVNAKDQAVLIMKSQDSEAYGTSMASGVGILIAGCDAGFVNNNHAQGGVLRPVWQIATAYHLGDVVRPSADSTMEFLCTTAGTSSATTEPNWPHIAGVTRIDTDIPDWTASTIYALHAFVKPTTYNGFVYECTARAGDFKSGASEPSGANSPPNAWPTTPNTGTVVDNNVTWTCRNSALVWTSQYSERVTCDINVWSGEESPLEEAMSSALGASLAAGIVLADLKDMQFTQCPYLPTEVKESNTFEAGAIVKVDADADADYPTEVVLFAGAVGVDALILNVEHVVYNYNDMPGILTSAATVHHTTKYAGMAALGYQPVVTVPPAFALDMGMLVIGATDVDARYNWWGDQTGPLGLQTGMGYGIGQALLYFYACVEYQPWLAINHEWCLDSHVGKFGKVILLQKCWNTFSVPIQLEDNSWNDFLALNQNFANSIGPAVYYDGTGWKDLVDPGATPPRLDYYLNPLDGIKVFVFNSTSVTILASSGDSWPTLALRNGWNLVGPNPPFCHDKIPAGDFVSSIVKADGGAFSHIISQGSSQPNWSYTLMDWRALDKGPDLLIGRAYWVYVNAPDDAAVLAGFGFTPIALYPE